jgi:hypothetical protein
MPFFVYIIPWKKTKKYNGDIMPINFDTNFSFNDPEVKHFLNESTLKQYSIKPSIMNEFEHDSSKDQRPSGEPKSHDEDIVFLREESWQLFEHGRKDPQTGELDGGSSVGIHNINVALMHNISLSIDYWLLLRKTLSDDSKVHARERFQAYKPLGANDDIDKWMRDNLNGKLTIDDFEIEPFIKVKKLRDEPDEVDISQREALFALFGGVDKPPIPRASIPDLDLHLGQWARERNTYLKLISIRVITDDADVPDSPHVDETLTDTNDSHQISNAVDRIVDNLIPSSCGKMNRHEFALLTLAAWPEFKIEWKRIRIKIGCSRITISIPILRVRISELVFFVYFKIPKDIGRFVFNLAKVCSQRAALTSAVIGIITSNLAAAIASFTPVFKRCLEQEIKTCLYPGLFMAKVPGQWH